MISTRIRVFLAAFLVVITTDVALSSQQECEVDSDGSCVDAGCVDMDEKCNEWMDAGEETTRPHVTRIAIMQLM